MKRIALIVLFTVLSLPVLADTSGSEELGERISGNSFVDRFQGDYLIELANGEKPEATNRNAKIAVDDGDIVFTFPFCIHGSACDPGYLFFPVKTVEVFKKSLSQERELFTLFAIDEGKKLKYTLEIDGSKFTFTNYQYVTPNQQTMTLVHVIKKASM